MDAYPKTDLIEWMASELTLFELDKTEEYIQLMTSIESPNIIMIVPRFIYS